MTAKPVIWQMIKEAAHSKPGEEITSSYIREYIRSHYGTGVNTGSIYCQTSVCTVNMPSRVHYPENPKPRKADPKNSRYDFLFSTGKGRFVLYDPEKHGEWEIKKDENGKLVVGRITKESVTGQGKNEAQNSKHDFPRESHLRDFLVHNIHLVRINGKQIKLYTDEQGREGAGYPTDIGTIDVLAESEDNRLLVLELRFGKEAESAVGQVALFMGWVKSNLAKRRSVEGVIVVKEADQKLKYAVSVIPGISIWEYDVDLAIRVVNS